MTTDVQRPLEGNSGPLPDDPKWGVGLRLGEILVRMGAIDAQTLEAALVAAREHENRLGTELLAWGMVDEEQLFEALARQRGLPLEDFDSVLRGFDNDLVNQVPRAYLEHQRIIPLRREGSRIVAVTVDPSATPWELAKALGASELDLRVLTPTNYRRVWSAIELGTTAAPTGSPAVATASRRNDLVQRPHIDSRLVTLFDALLLDAIAERASDIHLERYGERVRIRFRVDGHLHDVNRYALQSEDHAGLVNVIKIDGNLDISERRLPQGGRIQRKAGGRTYDMRVQTQPSLHGEHVVIRLLPQDLHPLSVEELGFPSLLAARYLRLLQNPQGLVLVVGPTGSGKSTTLYAGLQVLAADGTRKVITVEDPIEYALDGIQQTQVHPEIGFGFAQAMRSFVREDPDVILVGEIRDPETALETIRASQTGHLVLSTLHCNDTVDAVQRLIDLGMHPNSMGSEMSAVVSQRLVRRICSDCRAPFQPPASLLREIFPKGPRREFGFYKGAGCSRCDGRGTRGRVAAVEFLEFGPEIRRAISRQAAVDDLRQLARSSGLSSLRHNALELVQAGLVALDELPRILSAEQLREDDTASSIAA